MKHDVIVNKMTLKAGESIHDYLQALSNACRDHVMKKMNMTDTGDNYVVLAEAYGDAVVASVYKSDGRKGTHKYVACKYKRTESGFEFSDTQEVERYTGFRVKKSAALSLKSADGQMWQTK